MIPNEIETILFFTFVASFEIHWLGYLSATEAVFIPIIPSASSVKSEDSLSFYRRTKHSHVLALTNQKGGYHLLNKTSNCYPTIYFLVALTNNLVRQLFSNTGMSVVFCEHVHRKWLAMPGLDCSNTQLIEFFDTGIRCRWVIHNRIELRFVYVLKQITAKQVAAARQNSYGAF